MKYNILYTVLLTLFHVSLSLNTDEFVKAAQICSTPLKLCRHLQISATAVHFSKDKSDDVYFHHFIFHYGFTDNLYPGRHARGGHNLRHNQSTHLREGRLLLLALLLCKLKSTHVIESLRNKTDILSLVLLILFHPSLSEKLPKNRGELKSQPITVVLHLLAPNRK